MDLATLWRLAAHWHDERLEPGHARQDPAQASGIPARRRNVRAVPGILARLSGDHERVSRRVPHDAKAHDPKRGSKRSLGAGP
jgi:hypothetical protein